MCEEGSREQKWWESWDAGTIYGIQCFVEKWELACFSQRPIPFSELCKGLENKLVLTSGGN